MSYIPLNDLAQDLAIFEYEVRTTTPAGANGKFEVGQILTGGTSTETMVITQVISPTRYMVEDVSGTFTLLENLTSGGDTAKLLLSDAIAIQRFIDRSQGILERETGREFLNTSKATTYNFTSTKNTTKYLFPNHRLPILTITSITSNNITYTGTEGNGYKLDKEAGIIDFYDESQLKKPLYMDNLAIAYTYGYTGITAATLDKDIIEGILGAVQYMYGRWYQVAIAPGATSVNPGAFSMQFDTRDLYTEDFIRLISLRKVWLL